MESSHDLLNHLKAGSFTLSILTLELPQRSETSALHAQDLDSKIHHLHTS